MRVIYLGPPESVEVVRTLLPRTYEVSHATDEATVDRLLPDCDAILDAYMRVRFPVDRLSRGGRLKLFVTATTGADHVDAAALEARNIPLLTLAGQREVLRDITAAAEHSWLLLLACARRLRGAVADVLAGKWDRNRHPGLMLRGRVLGIVGCGRIGEWMSRYGTAFGMTCLGFDPHADPWPATIRRTDLGPLLEQSDVVTVHVPLNEKTKGLLGAVEFERLKPGAILVNTSRGEVLDEAALLRGLTSGRVGAAGLDVLTGEPEVENHPLVAYARSHENLIVTPHIGGFSPDALRHVLAFSCGRIVERLGG